MFPLVLFIIRWKEEKTNFSSNIISGVGIRIVMYELDKEHRMNV